MADVQKTIEIIFGATDQTGSAISSVGAGISDMSSSLQGATGPLREISEDVIGLEAAVLAAGVALAGFAVNEAGKFRDSVAEIGTLFEGTSEQVNVFGDDIIEYAANSTQSLESITSATYNAVSAGIAYEDALGALNQAEQLAIAGKADLNTSLDVLTSVMNAYGAANLDAAGKIKLAEEVSDALFTTVKEGKTTLPELAASLGGVTSIAANAGVEFDVLSAAVAALTASGVSTATAVTGIKAALSAIIKPSSQAAALAEDLGIEFNAAALKTKGFAAVLDEAKVATNGSTEQLALLFGGVEALAPVLALTGVGASKFNDSLAAMEQKTGAVSKAYEAMADNFALANQRIQNNLRISLIIIGDELLGGYKEIAAGLTDVFAALNIEFKGDAFDDLFGYLDAATKQIAGFLQEVAVAFPEAFAGVEFGDLIKSFDSLGGSVIGVFDGLDLTKPEDLQKAIQFVIDSFSSLTNVTAGVIDGLKPFIQEVISLVDGFNDSDDATKELTGSILGFANGLDRVLSVTGGVGAAISSLGGALTLMANVFTAKLLLDSLGKLPGLLTTSGGAGTAASGSLGTLTGSLGSLGNAIGLAGVALAAFEIGTYINETKGYSDALVEQLSAWTGLDEAAEKATETYTFSAEQMANLAKKQKELAESTSDLNKEQVKTTESVDGFTEAQKEAAAEMERAAHNAIQLGESYDPLTKSYREFKEPVEDLTKSMSEYGKTTDKVSEINVKTGGTLSVIESNAVDTSKAFKDAAERSEEFHTAMEGLASDERIRAMELSVDLQVAQVEADAKKVEAAFDSVASTINSTNELILGLSTAEAPAWDKFGTNLKKQIEAAEIRARELHESQIALIDAQTKNLTEQTKRMQSDEALIRIDSNGLEPHLDQLMWVILDKVRVRMAQNYSDFLVGDSCGGGV